MNINDLKPITLIKNKDCMELLASAFNNEFKLYTLNKAERTVNFNYVSENIDPYTNETNFSSYENNEQIHYEKGELIELNEEAIKELILNKKITDPNYIFLPPNDYNIVGSMYPSFTPVGLDDVYVEKSQLKPKTQNSSRSLAPHTLAIKEAFNNLGKNATNEQIYNWIKTKFYSYPRYENTLFAQLEFEGDSIDHYSTTSDKACILKQNGKCVSKKSFQDICSKQRRNMP